MNAFDVYQYWETDLRPYTLEALRKMTPEQLAYRPEGWHSSAWTLAVHMADCEWHWIYRNALKKAPWEERWDDGRFENVEQLITNPSRRRPGGILWLQGDHLAGARQRIPDGACSRAFPSGEEWLWEVGQGQGQGRGHLMRDQIRPLDEERAGPLGQGQVKVGARRVGAQVAALAAMLLEPLEVQVPEPQDDEAHEGHQWWEASLAQEEEPSAGEGLPPSRFEGGLVGRLRLWCEAWEHVLQAEHD